MEGALLCRENKNGGADINGYMPVAFEELLKNNRRFKESHTNCISFFLHILRLFYMQKSHIAG